MCSQPFDLTSNEVINFMSASHKALVGLVPLNPEISKDDEWRNPRSNETNDSEDP